MRLLHARADLLRAWDARGSGSRRAKSGDRRSFGPDGGVHGRRNPGADERQHLSLLRLPSDTRSDPRLRGNVRMKPFTYERAQSAAGAAKIAAQTPSARFLAGGTNLLDLMKLEIETPTHLIDVGRLPLAEIEE